jgi:serine/threonine-protein kinase
MATVYLGKATGMGDFERLVAIKAMHPHIAEKKEYVEMFLDEARLAARIRHPNVVAVVDVQPGEHAPFLVMDFVEGATLSEVLQAAAKKDQPPPLEVALRLVADMLAGLQAAHELKGKDRKPLGLVHRDVSPTNLMVGRDGIARLTDFGVARARVRIATTRAGQIKGKLGYLSPEAIEGQEVDQRCDIYAAGIVFWEALTGRRLFHAENEATVVMKVLRATQPAPSEINPAVPPAIDQVCLRALERNRERRFATAADLAQALEEAAAEAGVSIATTRVVAEYLASLELDIPSVSELPPAHEEIPLEELTTPAAPPVPHIDHGADPSSVTPVGDDPDELASAATGLPAPPPDTSAAVAMATPSDHGPLAARGTRVALIAIGVLLTAALVWALGRGDDGTTSPRSAAQPPTSGAAPEPSAPTASATVAITAASGEAPALDAPGHDPQGPPAAEATTEVVPVAPTARPRATGGRKAPARPGPKRKEYDPSLL